MNAGGEEAKLPSKPIFISAISMISLRSSAEIRGRPGPRFLLFHRQKSLKPLRCQATTVAGFTRARLSLRPLQKRDKRTQKTRSTARILGRGPRCIKHESWWRSATFSATRSARSLKTAAAMERNSASLNGIQRTIASAPIRGKSLQFRLCIE